VAAGLIGAKAVDPPHAHKHQQTDPARVRPLPRAVPLNIMASADCLAELGLIPLTATAAQSLSGDESARRRLLMRDAGGQGAVLL